MSATSNARTASFPLVMAFSRSDPVAAARLPDFVGAYRNSFRRASARAGKRLLQPELRALHHAPMVRIVRRRALGPAHEIAPHPAPVVVVDAERVDRDAGHVQAVQPLRM